MSTLTNLPVAAVFHASLLTDHDIYLFKQGSHFRLYEKLDPHTLQQDYSLQFFDVNNDSLLCYAKTTPDNAEIILVVANLDPHHTRTGWVTLPLDALGLDEHQSYQVQDLLPSARFLWNGARNYVEINPQVAPAHIFKLRRRVRTEHDFDYFL